MPSPAPGHPFEPPPPMKIAVLHPSYADSLSANIEVDVPLEDFSRLLPEHEVTELFLDKATCVAVTRETKADVFINCCDGAMDEDTPGIEIVELLEQENRAFTGAGSAFYDPTRAQMKEACQRHGLGTPAFAFAWDEEGIDDAFERLRLPCIVKPHHGHGSDGIEPGSRVLTEQAFREQARKIIATFGGALIEEFIAGRELTVLIASNPADENDPILYRPVECIFDSPEEFKTFDYKWRGTKNPWIRCEDDALSEALQAMTRTLYLALGGTGYARTDIRMDAEGRLYLLEINPNCAIFYPDDNGGTADIILAYDGKQKIPFLHRMIDYAFVRQKKRRG
ncbi:MAG: ATP-grasp domain-containing protein [Byssovorax sp.]